MRTQTAHRLRTFACAGMVAFAVACGGGDEPKTSTLPSVIPTAPGATPAPATPTATLVPGTPPPVATAPGGSTELAPGDYPNLTASALSCDGNNILVLRTKEATYYLQTLARPNFTCENVRTNIVSAAGLKGERPDIVEGRVFDLKYAKLERATEAGSYQVNLTWKDSGSILVIVVQGWQRKG